MNIKIPLLPKPKKLQKLKDLLTELSKIVPKDKESYWIVRILKCKSIFAKIKLCEDLKKHFKEEIKE